MHSVPSLYSAWHFPALFDILSSLKKGDFVRFWKVPEVGNSGFVRPIWESALRDCTSSTTYRYLNDFTFLPSVPSTISSINADPINYESASSWTCALSPSLSTPTAVMLIWVSSASCMITTLRCLSAYRLRNKFGKRLNNFDKRFLKGAGLK